MPEIASLEFQWPTIVRDIFGGESAATPQPFAKQISDGYFAAALLKWPEQWQRQVLILFPYDDEAWRVRAAAVLAFEAHCWDRWCALQEALAATRSPACPPLWWNDSEPQTRTGEARVVVDGRDVSMPYLLRPYVSFPSLRERPVSNSVLTELSERLRQDAEWVFGTGDLTEYLAIRNAPEAAPLTGGSRWARLRSLFSLRRTHFRWTPPPDQEIALQDGISRLDHFLCDGSILVPTRWRAFHRDYSGFGRLQEHQTRSTRSFS
jgi:hypothetical protein